MENHLYVNGILAMSFGHDMQEISNVEFDDSCLPDPFEPRRWTR